MSAYTKDNPIQLEIDATGAAQGLLHVRMKLPVQPGRLLLYYPKWIPGEHGPTGPITNVAGLKIIAGDSTLSWQRDPLDMYTFQCEIPRGVDAVLVEFDFLLTSDGRFTSGASATPNLAVINWNQVLLYPAGPSMKEIFYRPAIVLPEGWQFGTALDVVATEGNRVEFETVSLERLVDSPLLAGRYFRRVPISDDAGVPPHYVDIAADSPEALDVPEQTVSAWKKLVKEALALFGTPHYRRYHFLLALSEHIEHFGLEHHESSDNRSSEMALVKEKQRNLMAGLLPHEFVHSWNGKYRRPADMIRSNYQEPINTELLWVYEGLTSYLGDVLTARSGLLSPELYREDLASVAATLDHRPGRQWRPLVDTAIAAQILFPSPPQWASWRRRTDFYGEGVLIWLEADVLIRRLTGGQRSLDDFCRAFYGGGSREPAVIGYTYHDLIEALNQVVSYDWDGFFKKRIYQTTEHAPLKGIEQAGWKLRYNDQKNKMEEASEDVREITLELYTLGFYLDKNGRIRDVVPGMPAHQAGLGPDMKVIAVNGRKYSPDVLRNALKQASQAHGIEILVEDDEFYRTHRVHYSGGLRFPHLQRDEAQEDILSQIITPRTVE